VDAILKYPNTSIDSGTQAVARVKAHAHTSLRNRAWMYPGSEYAGYC